jgi:hypothetical protein
MTLGLRNYGGSLRYVSQQLRLLCGISLHLRLWAGFAALKGGRAGARASRPIPAPERAADGGGPLGPGRRRRVRWHREKRCEVRDQGTQRRRRCELVILARKLHPRARPWPVLGTAHQPRDHRIERDVTDRRGSSITPAPKRPWNRWPVSRKRSLVRRNLLLRNDPTHGSIAHSVLQKCCPEGSCPPNHR